MKNCPNCHAPMEDNVAFCPNCGAPANGQPGYQQPPFAPPVFNPWDHTKEFDAADIATNKIFALLCYLMGLPGVVIALLGPKESMYTQFHIRQALKITILEVLLGIATGLLAWTILFGIVGGVMLLILQVVKIICFVQVCQNKACEPWMVRSFKFLG